MTMRLSHSSLTGHRAHAGGGRHGQRGVHVLGGAGRGAAQDRVRRLVLRRGRLGGLGLLGDRAGGALGRLGGLGVGARACALGAGCRLRAGRLRPRSSSGLAPVGLVSAGFAAGAFAVVEPGEPLADGRGRRGGRLRRRRCLLPTHAARRRGLEVRDPDRVDALGVALVLVEHLLDQPLVGPEVGGGLAKGLVGLAARRLRHGWVRLFLRCVRMKLDPVDQVSPRHEQMPTRSPAVRHGWL